MRYKKCICCEESIKDEDYMTYTDLGKAIHESCKSDDESEPLFKVVPIGNNLDFDNLVYSGYGLTSFSVGYYHDQTDGLFTNNPKYNNWRGYDCHPLYLGN